MEHRDSRILCTHNGIKESEIKEINAEFMFVIYKAFKYKQIWLRKEKKDSRKP